MCELYYFIAVNLSYKNILPLLLLLLLSGKDKNLDPRKVNISLNESQLSLFLNNYSFSPKNTFECQI